MAYILNKTDQSQLVVVDDGTVNTSACSLTLIGRNVTTYGESQNENFIRLLENFANTTPPVFPLEGQVWFDQSVKQLKVRIGTQWQGVNTLTKSITEPADLTDGDLWYREDTGEVFVRQLHLGNYSYKLLGPVSGKGKTASYLTRETLTGREVTSLYLGSTRAVVFSDNEAFTGPAGFATIYPGVNLNSTVTGAVFAGTARDSQALGGLTSSQYMRSDANTGTTGNLSVTGVSNAGSADQASMFVDSVAWSTSTRDNSSILRNNVQGRTVALRVRTGVSEYQDLLIADAGTGAVYVQGDLFVSGSFAAKGLTQSREIALAGVVTGNVNFDGTSDVTITTTFAEDRVKKAGDSMTGQLTADAGLVVNTSSTANLLVANVAGVGIGTATPVVALDVAGAIRSVPQIVTSVGGSITVSGAHNNHHVTLTGPGAATFVFSNFTEAGQIMRIAIGGTNFGVNWPGSVRWPNGVAPNLAAGPQKIAVVTLLRLDSSNVLATYVSY